ncbi:MAG: sulfite exporter TauE/SafE family protein [Aestuariibacter sp.]
MAIFAGCVLQTSTGFGMAVIAAPIIILLKPEWIPVVVTLISMALNMVNTLSQREHIRWRKISSSMIAFIPGSIIGGVLLNVIDHWWIQVITPIMVISGLTISCWARPFQPNYGNLSIAGFFSGLFGTTTSIGGPPMALVMQHTSGNTTRANLSVFFLFSTIFSLMIYLISGFLTPADLQQAVTILPFAFVGFISGHAIKSWVDTKLRMILITVCGSSACWAMLNTMIQF